LHTIVKEEGVAALWRGSGILVVRGGLLSAGQWLGYDGVKTECKERGLLTDGTLLHVLASLAGGFMSATLACPPDVIMTQWTTALQQGKQYASVGVRSTAT
jgi:solute carrier family 25 oxoglutarate transporter 11